MKESTKKTFKNLGTALMAFGIFIFVAFAIPDYSLFKNIFAYIMMLLLIFGILWFTGLGNPIKSLFRKIFKKEEDKSV